MKRKYVYKYKYISGWHRLLFIDENIAKYRFRQLTFHTWFFVLLAVVKCLLWSTHCIYWYDVVNPDCQIILLMAGWNQTHISHVADKLNFSVNRRTETDIQFICNTAISPSNINMRVRAPSQRARFSIKMPIYKHADFNQIYQTITRPSCFHNENQYGYQDMGYCRTFF